MRRSSAWRVLSASAWHERRKLEKGSDLMRAAVYEGEGRLVVRDVPDPFPAPDEVLIEVEACGICGSDVQIINVPPGHPSTPPVTIGHELVGRIRAVGSAVRGDVEVGSRVVVDPDPKCGACASCRAGRPANCVNIVALGVHRDGALAGLVTTPANTAYPISEDLPSELAALVEPLACVVNGTNRAALRPGEAVVVFGAGAIGCLFIAVFRASGAGRIIAIEPSVARAPVARAVGADLVLTPDEWAAQRKAILPAGADVVVDAVGSVLPQAIEAAAMGARVVVFGMNGNARPPVHQIEIVEKGLSIMGSYISNFTFPAAIRLVESGQLNLAPMITATIPLEDTLDGIARLRAGDAVKVVIKP
jgi:threonine dehydrogenase-like Zn-dependent dehydrogenase